jgi:hypothetical protein
MLFVVPRTLLLAEKRLALTINERRPALDYFRSFYLASGDAKSAPLERRMACFDAATLAVCAVGPHGLEAVKPIVHHCQASCTLICPLFLAKG